MVYFQTLEHSAHRARGGSRWSYPALCSSYHSWRARFWSCSSMIHRFLFTISFSFPQQSCAHMVSSSTLFFPNFLSSSLDHICASFQCNATDINCTSVLCQALSYVLEKRTPGHVYWGLSMCWVATPSRNLMSRHSELMRWRLQFKVSFYRRDQRVLMTCSWYQGKWAQCWLWSWPAWFQSPGSHPPPWTASQKMKEWDMVLCPSRTVSWGKTLCKVPSGMSDSLQPYGL